MSDITTPDALTQAPSPQESGSTLSDAFKTNPRLSSSVLVDRLASLLNSSNSRPVVEGLKLTAEIANISPPSPVSPTEEQQATVAVITRGDILRVGAALAATIRDESARFDWQAHPSLGSFLQQMYGRHPEAQEALVTGATLNARALRPRAQKDHAPLPPSPIPSPAVTPTVPPSDPATVSPLITLPCIKCKQAPRRPQQRTCKGCHADAMRESRRRKRTRERAVALPQPISQWPPNPSQDQATCEWCEQTFKLLHWGQRFCGNICGGKAATAAG